VSAIKQKIVWHCHVDPFLQFENVPTIRRAKNRKSGLGTSHNTGVQEEEG